MRNFLALGFLIAGVFCVDHAKAAPCCAGSSALPSLITGDESRFLSVGISSGEVVGDAAALGKGLPVFRDEKSTQESRRNLSLSFASLISDRWQLGVSALVVQNSLLSKSLQESKTLFGDLSATIGFEAVPEWEYSEWKPRVFTFAQWVVPTGRSMAESRSLLASDVSGLGFHQLHLGAIAIKRWSDWDVNLVGKLGKEFSFGSTFLNGSLGGGYSFAERWRAGLNLETQYQSPMRIDGQYTSPKMVWNSSATMTCLIGSDSSLIAGYTDQTLFGPAYNTTLARTFLLTFQQRWER